MATNNFLPFCPTDTGTNLLSQGAYAAATGRTTGNQPGIASSQLNNKALRQAAFVASQIAQFIGDVTGADTLDDGNTAKLLGIMQGALIRINPYERVFTSTSTYKKSFYFMIAEGNATAGATYTNNSITYTVVTTIAAGFLLHTTGTGDPEVSGTLTKSAGTGDATLTFYSFRKPLYASAIVVGGGGGGAGANSAASEGSVGAGGGGGGASLKIIFEANLGDTETVTIGAGGTAGASSGSGGGTGGTTSFGSHCSATGGGGGNAQTTGTAAARSGDPGTGGVGSSGDVNIRGGSATWGFRNAASVFVPSNGGDSTYGGGGTGANANAGNIGGTYGGGGGGASSFNNSDFAGGAGSPGVCILTEHFQ